MHGAVMRPAGPFVTLQLAVKRLVDIVGATMGLAVCSPLLMAAAVAALPHRTQAALLDALEESDPSAFTFEDEAIEWRDKRISADKISAFRSEFAISFGSCSFREPLEELAYLTRRARSAAQ